MGRPRESWTAATQNGTEQQLARIKEDHVDKASVSHPLETIQSNKVATSRALSQTKELKRQLEEMQDVFDKLELTEQLQKEQHVTKELGRGRTPNASRASTNSASATSQRAIMLVQRHRPDLQRASAQQRHPPLDDHNDNSVIDMPDKV
ncbi:hypothetical protein ISCGN_032396 [Ixodes scapularis]